jgi:Hsp90 protein
VLAKLVRFQSTHENGVEPVSLQSYVGRMKEGQSSVYYICADSRYAATELLYCIVVLSYYHTVFCVLSLLVVNNQKWDCCEHAVRGSDVSACTTVDVGSITAVYMRNRCSLHCAMNAHSKTATTAAIATAIKLLLLFL